MRRRKEARRLVLLPSGNRLGRERNCSLWEKDLGCMGRLMHGIFHPVPPAVVPLLMEDERPGEY